MTTRSFAPVPDEQAIGRALGDLARVVAEVAGNRRATRDRPKPLMTVRTRWRLRGKRAA